MLLTSRRFSTTHRRSTLLLRARLLNQSCALNFLLVPVISGTGPAHESGCLRSSSPFCSFCRNYFQLLGHDLTIHRRPPKESATLFGGSDTCGHALGNQFTFVLGQSCQESEHQSAGGRGRVDAVRDGAHLDAASPQLVNRAQYVEQRTPQPIDSPNDHNVACLCIVEEVTHARSRRHRLRARSDVREDVALLHPGGEQGIELKCCILRLG